MARVIAAALPTAVYVSAATGVAYAPRPCLLLTFLLLLAPCCCWLPCCCYVPAVAGDPTVAVSLLLMNIKKIKHFRLSDYDCQSGNFFCYRSIDYRIQ